MLTVGVRKIIQGDVRPRYIRPGLPIDAPFGLAPLIQVCGIRQFDVIADGSL